MTNRFEQLAGRSFGASILAETLEDIQDFATRWLSTYNHDQPNMALGGITPKQKLASVA